VRKNRDGRPERHAIGQCRSPDRQDSGGGACRYRYDLVKEPPAADDIVLSRDGATVLIDAVSLDYMGGSEIDFVDDLIGQSFQIKNPHAVASCGCGTSFSI
jgi:iron-sulfur cluster assembly accessory protein